MDDSYSIHLFDWLLTYVIRLQHNFTLVVLAIVLVSVLPIVLEVLAARRYQEVVE